MKIKNFKIISFHKHITHDFYQDIIVPKEFTATIIKPDLAGKLIEQILKELTIKQSPGFVMEFGYGSAPAFSEERVKIKDGSINICNKYKVLAFIVEENDPNFHDKIRSQSLYVIKKEKGLFLGKLIVFDTNLRLNGESKIFSIKGIDNDILEIEISQPGSNVTKTTHRLYDLKKFENVIK